MGLGGVGGARAMRKGHEGLPSTVWGSVQEGTQCQAWDPVWGGVRPGPCTGTHLDRQNDRQTHITENITLWLFHWCVVQYHALPLNCSFGIYLYIYVNDLHFLLISINSY